MSLKHDLRYWRNHRGPARGLHWVECTNERGLELPHCDALHRTHGRGQLTVHNLHEADVYGLGDIHSLAEQECAHGARGAFAGYGWTDKLLHYADQPEFRDEIAELAPLTDVPAPEHPGTAMQCLHDRQAQYRAHQNRAHADLVHAQEVYAREAAPHEDVQERPSPVVAADHDDVLVVEAERHEPQEPELDDDLEI